MHRMVRKSSRREELKPHSPFTRVGHVDWFFSLDSVQEKWGEKGTEEARTNENLYRNDFSLKDVPSAPGTAFGEENSFISEQRRCMQTFTY